MFGRNYISKTELKFLPNECHICGATENDTELYKCERCDELYCEKCGTKYTLHNQIDYNCCSVCGYYNPHDYI